MRFKDVWRMLSRDSIHCEEFSALIHIYSDNGMFRFESIPTNNERGVPFVVRKRRERKKLAKDDIPFGLMLFSVFCVARRLHTSVGMRRSSRLEYGLKQQQPLLTSLWIRALITYRPLWVCGAPRAWNTDQNSISHCYRLYESEHSYCFTIFNSPLGTFTSGQTFQ